MYKTNTSNIRDGVNIVRHQPPYDFTDEFRLKAPEHQKLAQLKGIASNISCNGANKIMP